MKKLLALVLVLMMALCSVSALAEDASGIKLGQVQWAAHGAQCFAVITVAVQGDTIIAAYIDEYQVMSGEGVVGVPNSDAAFGANIVDSENGKVLGSKRVNSDFYSGNMASRAGSTQPIVVSWQGIEAYAAGKTIAELEAAIADKESAEVLDIVSTSTLVDTKGYLTGIIEAAKAAVGNQAGHYTVYNKTGENVTEIRIAVNAINEAADNLLSMPLAPDASIELVKIIPGNLDAHHALTFTYVTESGRIGEFATLSIEDVPMTLLAADAMTGATPLNFFTPAE